MRSASFGNRVSHHGWFRPLDSLIEQDRYCLHETTVSILQTSIIWTSLFRNCLPNLESYKLSRSTSSMISQSKTLLPSNLRARLLRTSSYNVGTLPVDHQVDHAMHCLFVQLSRGTLSKVIVPNEFASARALLFFWVHRWCIG